MLRESEVRLCSSWKYSWTHILAFHCFHVRNVLISEKALIKLAFITENNTLMLQSNVNRKSRNDDRVVLIITGGECCVQWKDRACINRQAAQVDCRDIKNIEPEWLSQKNFRHHEAEHNNCKTVATLSFPILAILYIIIIIKSSALANKYVRLLLMQSSSRRKFYRNT